MAIEAVKIAPEHQNFLDEHFGVSPRWDALQRKTKNPSFVDAVQADTRSDDKLKMFVTALAMREQAKGPAVKAPSDVSGSYKVRYHPAQDRFSCSCPDWTYKRSISGADCKHITRIKDASKEKLMQQTKQASPAEVLFRIGKAVRSEHKTLNDAGNLKQENAVYQQAYPREGFLSAFMKKQAEIQEFIRAQAIPPMLKQGYALKFKEDAEMAKKMAQAAKRML